MRILIIHNQYQHLGGEDFVMKQEWDALSLNNEVAVYNTKNIKGLKGYIQYLTYPINWSETKKIMEMINQFKPDLIHIHNMHYALGPLFILHIKKTKIPMVMTLHNFRLLCPSATLFHDGNIFLDSIDKQFPWRAVKNKVLENSLLKTFWTAFTYWIHRKRGTFNAINKYIVLSEFAKNLFAKSTFPVNLDKFTVKPNFVIDLPPTEVIKEDAFVYVGRLSDEKGILPLLHAWKATNHHLKIFGTGPLQQEVELIATNSPNIEYFGFQDKQIVNNHIAGAFAVIVPSVCYESMPLAVLEAYALGIPVLASNIGILNEMVVPLYTGMLFDPYHHSDIVKTLAAWKSLPAEQHDIMKLNCRKVYEQKYKESIVMEQLNAIYLDVLENAKYN